MGSYACFPKKLCQALHPTHCETYRCMLQDCVYALQLMELDCVMPFPRRLLYIRLCCKTLILEIAINRLD